tara:strand:+ start:134 stop:655 length:522 start_codon:yes stop_codon:yes gene_type:complete
VEFDIKAVEDKLSAKSIFTEAHLCNDRNYRNYTPQEFDKYWGNSWIKFFVMFDKDNPVSFSGVRDFGRYVRIFDRYFVFPEYRHIFGKSSSEKVNFYIHTLTDPKIIGDKIPFFSIERINRRRSIINATERINEVLPEEKKFHVLDGMYEVVNDSWQHISIQRPHSIDLKRRD